MLISRPHSLHFCPGSNAQCKSTTVRGFKTKDAGGVDLGRWGMEIVRDDSGGNQNKPRWPGKCPF